MTVEWALSIILTVWPSVQRILISFFLLPACVSCNAARPPGADVAAGESVADPSAFQLRLVDREKTDRLQSNWAHLEILRDIQLAYRSARPDARAFAEERLAELRRRNLYIDADEEIALYWRRARAKPSSPMLPRELRVLDPDGIGCSDLTGVRYVRGRGVWDFGIQLRLKRAAAKRLERMLRENVDRSLAYAIGGKVFSDPIIRADWAAAPKSFRSFPWRAGSHEQALALFKDVKACWH